VRTSAQLRLIAALAVAVAVVMTPAVLLAHARLLRSAPSADATLSEPPTSLQLWFSERPELRFSILKLLDSAGTPVPIGAIAKIAGDAMGLSAPIPVTLANGRYTVSWRTAAADGHPTSGMFSFVVAVGKPAVRLAGSDTDSAHRSPPRVPNTVVEPAVVTSVPTAVRWADLVAVLTLVGTMSFGLFVVPTAHLSADVARDAGDRARRLASSVLLLFVVTTMWRLAAQATLATSGASGRTAAMMTVVRETAWGFGWLVGAVSALVVGIGLMLARSGSLGWVIAALGTAGVALSEGLTGHPAASSHAPLATVVDTVHVLGAGGWVGGLTAVTLCGLAATRRMELSGGTAASRQLVRAFHRSAIACVTIVLVTAVVAAWLRLTSVSDLWVSTYGRVLLLKIAFAAVLLGFGWFHWRTVVVPEWTDDTRFRFRRSVAFELVFGAGIVAVTAVLVTTTLPGS
jgi:putative copper export protein/methionine-rich copper-binding protein CopC